MDGARGNIPTDLLNDFLLNICKTLCKQLVAEAKQPQSQFMKRKEANLEIKNSGKVRVFTFPDFMSSKLWLHESALIDNLINRMAVGQLGGLGARDRLPDPIGTGVSPGG